MTKLFLAASFSFWAAAAAADTFTIGVDVNALDFGGQLPGANASLGGAGYFNEVTTISDHNAAYYLKIYDTAPLTSGSRAIPNSCFRWLTTYTDGAGTLNYVDGHTFDTTPILAYTAAGADLTGTAVHTRFRYTVVVPDNQVAGTYLTTVIYLLTETL